MIQLVVTYFNHQIMYYPVSADEGWRIDDASRQIIIGKGLPRKHIPLDKVACYSVEEVKPRRMHAFIKNPNYPSLCVNASEDGPTRLCWKTEAHSDHFQKGGPI